MVRNGQKIKIWSDKYLPTPLTFKVISPMNLSRVCDLISSKHREWKSKVVKIVDPFVTIV